jgi:hypothetical protein
MFTVTVMAGRPRKFPVMEYLASAANLDLKDPWGSKYIIVGNIRGSI